MELGRALYVSMDVPTKGEMRGLIFGSYLIIITIIIFKRQCFVLWRHLVDPHDNLALRDWLRLRCACL